MSEHNQKDSANADGQSRPVGRIISCPVCQRGDIWQEAVNRTEYVYDGVTVKNGKEVIDYLLAEVYSLLGAQGN